LWSASASATVCRVIRRLFLFCFGGGAGASYSRSSVDFCPD
jgi:hypothetical protein